MQFVSVAFIAVLIAGYLLTEGAVIGAGLLSPGLGARRVGTSIGALFLGSEVWLVATIGLFAGMFPSMEASLLATGYPILVAFLLGWIARDASLWFGPRIARAGWQAFWGIVLGVSSAIMAVCFGGMIGLALSGAADAGHGATFEVSRLGAPAVWICAIILPVILGVHGRVFVAYREGGPSGGLGWITSIAMVGLGVFAAVFGSGSLSAALVDERSAQLIASIALPGFLVVLGVQVLWWWIATRGGVAPALFFTWQSARD